MELLYKLPQIDMLLDFADGRTLRYRFVSGMARTPVLISPLVMTNRDFMLLSGGARYLDSNRVKGIRLVAAGRWRRPSFRLRLSALSMPPTDLSALQFLDPVMRDAGKIERVTANCDFGVNSVNERPPDSAMVASGVLSIVGWSFGFDRTAPSDAVFVTLTDPRGQQTLVRARTAPRPDVKEAFRRPEMPDPGFEAFFDVSALSGPYTLGVAQQYGDQIVRCRQMALRVVIQ